MGNKQSGSNGPHVPPHVGSDNSASAHSTSVPRQSAAAAAAVAVPEFRYRPVWTEHSPVLLPGIPTQSQINVMGNRQSGSNRPHVPAHFDSDNSASAHSTSVAPQSAAAGAAPSAPPGSRSSVPQTETSASNTFQTQDSPQTQAGNYRELLDSRIQSEASFLSPHLTLPQPLIPTPAQINVMGNRQGGSNSPHVPAHVDSDNIAAAAVAVPELRYRPVLPQHSAVLQPGIPTQPQINVMDNRQSGSNRPHVPPHVDSDNIASAHSSSVARQSATAAVAVPELRYSPVLPQHSALLQPGIPTQPQINVMDNRQSGSNRPHLPAHVYSDNSASAHSRSVAPQSAAARAAPSAPPGSRSSAPQTETSARNTDQTQDSSQTQAGRRKGTAQAQNSDQGFVPQPTFDTTPGRTTMDTLSEDVLKELECPVCKEYMLPPIGMCETGHSICSNCRPNLVKCPTCRQPFLNLRNKALELLSLRAKHPCCYKLYGCKLAFSADMKTDHEIVCPYRPYKCPLLRDNLIKCQWSGILEDLKEHIRNDHKDRITYIKSGKHICIRRYREKKIYTRVIFAMNEMFYQQFEVIDNIFYFVIQHIGPENYGSYFQYNFNLATNDNVEFVTVGFVARSFKVDIEDIHKSGQCVKLCYDTVKNYMGNGNDFNFYFGIKKIE